MAGALDERGERTTAARVVLDDEDAGLESFLHDARA
jgi:hypothetical protein